MRHPRPQGRVGVVLSIHLRWASSFAPDCTPSIFRLVGLVQALGIINLPSLRNRDGIHVKRNMVAVQAVSDQLRGDDGVDVGSIYHAPLSSVANPDVPRVG